MTHKYPYGGDRKEADKARVDKFLGRKDGGRASKKDDGDTNIHIEVNAKPEQEAADLPVPPMAGPIPPPPPMPPPGMGPGAGPGGPPIPGGGPIVGLKRGGAATMTAGAMSGEGREEKTAITKRQRPKG